jgi:hypothetical protein
MNELLRSFVVSMDFVVGIDWEALASSWPVL